MVSVEIMRTASSLPRIPPGPDRPRQGSPGLACLCLLFLAVLSTSAAPRPGVPPLPENYLNNWDFNGASWLTNARSAPLAAVNLHFVDGWSDQALHMAGPERALLALAERAGDGMLNLPMNAPGTVRFYFSPAWSSASAV